MIVVFFTNWTMLLQNSDLGAYEKRAFAITIRWYLSFLKHKQQFSTFDSVHEFREWAVAEKTDTSAS